MAAISVRKTAVGGRHELDRLVAIVNARALFGYPNIGDGSTAGRLRTNAAVPYRIGGLLASLASTNDLWDLHSETATSASNFRAYWLYQDGTFTAGTTDETTAAKALAALPDPNVAKAVIGVYVAGNSTNFANALAAQGTIYNGIPDGAGWLPSAGLDASSNRVGGIANAITLVAP